MFFYMRSSSEERILRRNARRPKLDKKQALTRQQKTTIPFIYQSNLDLCSSRLGIRCQRQHRASPKNFSAPPTVQMSLYFGKYFNIQLEKSIPIKWVYCNLLQSNTSELFYCCTQRMKRLRLHLFVRIFPS